MTRRLFIACGAIETRAALIAADEIIGLWFGPARGDEGLARAPEAGDIHQGRIKAISKPLNGAFVDIGSAREALLPFPKEGGPTVEGARAIVRVRRPAIGAKGPIVAADWRQGLGVEEISAIAAAAETPTPRRLNTGEDAALRAWRFFADRKPARVMFDSVDAAQSWRRIEKSAPFEIVDGAEISRNLDAVLDAALDRVVALPGGARLIIDETEGLTVVDVDAGATIEGAGARVNDRVNAAAAAVLFQELSRRGIGGRVVVDFLPVGNRAARAAFLKTLADAPKDGYDCRLGELFADGLFDLTAPRTRLSLLEQASELDGASPRPGRRFTLDWSAKRAIGALEQVLRSAPASRPRLLAGVEIGDYLAARPQWRVRLAARYGARFDIVADPKLEGRSFDLAE